MRGRPCSICGSDKLTEIDSALAAGNTILRVAATFNIPKSCVHRHKLNCLAPKIKAAAKAVQSTKDAKAPVIRAREIAAGATPSVEDVLSLHALLERMARSLDRLEQSAVAASSDGLHTALAAVSGQISRSVETAARLQNIGYKDATQAQQGEKFSVNIIIPQVNAAQPLTLDCTREEHEAPVPQLTARRNASYAFGFDESEQGEED